jgi:transport and Golgi organization protein 2
MCTVTFIPRRKGYYLGMNRDEKRTRAKGFPPARKTLNGSTVIYPSEPGGGTWIALNEWGVALALINWYSVATHVNDNTVSRGKIIPALSSAENPKRVNSGLGILPLHRINPFRLIGVFPGSGDIVEWRWDLKQLVQKSHPWRAQQWISSGFDEPTAQRVRGETFRHARAQKPYGTITWLRRLHRSHSPEKGPFSTCMHRDDATTVSYTELSFVDGRPRMRHACGAPCSDTENPHASDRRVDSCDRFVF